MSETKQKIPRCRASILKADTYRYTGRGIGGFEMHYREQQCSFRAAENGRCRKHPAEKGFVDYRSPMKFKD